MIGDALALLALAAAVAALVSAARVRLARGGDPAALAAGAGALAVLGLASLDRGALLRVRYDIGDGRVVAPDAALVLALALLACLGAALVLAAEQIARSAERPAPSPLGRATGRSALLIAVGLIVLGIGLVVLRVRGAGLLAGIRGDLAALGLAFGGAVLGAAAMLRRDAPTTGDVERHQRHDDLFVRAAVALTAVAAIAAGVEAWMRTGSVVTRDLQALLAAALVGLAAVAPTGLAIPRRALLVVTLVAAVAR